MPKGFGGSVFVSSQSIILFTAYRDSKAFLD